MNIVGSCPHCGAPIYAIGGNNGGTAGETSPPINQFSCECRHDKRLAVYRTPDGTQQFKELTGDASIDLNVNFVDPKPNAIGSIHRKPDRVLYAVTHEDNSETTQLYAPEVPGEGPVSKVEKVGDQIFAHRANKAGREVSFMFKDQQWAEVSIAPG